MTTLEWILIVHCLLIIITIGVIFWIKHDIFMIDKKISDRMGELILTISRSSKAEGNLEGRKELKKETDKKDLEVPAPVVVVKNLDK